MATIKIDNIPPMCTEAILHYLLKAAGNILSIRICRRNLMPVGSAFANYETPANAMQAVELFNGNMILGSIVSASICPTSPWLNVSRSVFVANVPQTADANTLGALFSSFGPIESCIIKGRGEEPRYGIVTFQSIQSAKTAVEKSSSVPGGEQLSTSRFAHCSQCNASNEVLECTVSVFGLNSAKMAAVFAFLRTLRGLRACIVKESPVSGPVSGQCIFLAPFLACEALGTIREVRDSDVCAAPLQCKCLRVAPPVPVATQQGRAAKRAEPTPGHNLYIKNLAETVDDSMLKDLFHCFGEVTSAKVMMDDKNPPQSRGFGFVCFKDLECANQAMRSIQGLVVEGRPLYINVAQRKEVRRATLELQYAQRMGRGAARQQQQQPSTARVARELVYSERQPRQAGPVYAPCEDYSTGHLYSQHMGSESYRTRYERAQPYQFASQHQPTAHNQEMRQYPVAGPRRDIPAHDYAYGCAQPMYPA